MKKMYPSIATSRARNNGLLLEMKKPFPQAIRAVLLIIALHFVAGASAQETAKVPPTAPPTAAEILALIEANGKMHFADASADLAAATARLDAARAGLFPRLTATAEAKRLNSTLSSNTDSYDFQAGFELIQPIYDFGQTYSRIDAADLERSAADVALIAARNTVLVEGLAVFFELHASELEVQFVDQRYASDYVKWDRDKERMGVGQRSPIEVAGRLATAEKSRLDQRRAKSRNLILRLRLGELTGTVFDTEMYNPPKGPKKPPPTPEVADLQKLAEVRNPDILVLRKNLEAVRARRQGTGSRPRLEAFGEVNKYQRDSRLRDEWAAGARLVWPMFDGGLKSAERARLAAEEGRLTARYDRRLLALRRRAHELILAQADAWQQLVAARAGFDFAKKSLLQRQRLYETERVTDLGPMMVLFTEAEADVVRAAGAFFVERARLAVLFGEPPRRGLEDNFLFDLLGKKVDDAPKTFRPKGGSGFGQDDQDKVNINIKNR